jgi:hypothetical protein
MRTVVGIAGELNSPSLRTQAPHILRPVNTNSEMAVAMAKEVMIYPQPG